MMPIDRERTGKRSFERVLGAGAMPGARTEIADFTMDNFAGAANNPAWN
jgi:hypothetical protein